jgi:hypothetical protein
MPASSTDPRLTYLADVDHPLQVTIGETSTAWDVPAAPILPDGKPAVRFALIPADCRAIGFVGLWVDAPRSPDPWASVLSFAGSAVVEDGISMVYDGRPELPDDSCHRGAGPGFLEVGYFRLADAPASIDVSARAGEGSPAVREVAVLPVHTDIDAELPVYTQSRQTIVGPATGDEATETGVAYPFSVATLPDGTTATRWQARVTGCGVTAPGRGAVEVWLSVGDRPPVSIGSCEGQSFGQTYFSGDVELPVPPDGTPIRITERGAAGENRVQVSEYQWREVP